MLKFVRGFAKSCTRASVPGSFSTGQPVTVNSFMDRLRTFETIAGKLDMPSSLHILNATPFLPTRLIINVM